jgi:hypothetical protein
MKRSNGKRSSEIAESTRALQAVERILGRSVTLQDCAGVLKAEDAARFLGLDISTVRHLTCRGELPHIKTGKRGVGYQLIDLIEWLEARRVPARQ